jgi:hypothetical protein
MRANFKLAAVAVILGLPALLVGCRSGYDVDVWNRSDQPVQARLVTQHEDGAGLTLAQTRLGPGDRGSLFKQVDSNTRVALEVDCIGAEYPATMDLARGKTVVDVEGTHGHIRVSPAQRP